MLLCKPIFPCGNRAAQTIGEGSEWCFKAEVVGSSVKGGSDFFHEFRSLPCTRLRVLNNPQPSQGMLAFSSCAPQISPPSLCILKFHPWDAFMLGAVENSLAFSVLLPSELALMDSLAKYREVFNFGRFSRTLHGSF